MARLILDTSVLVAAERRRSRLAQLIGEEEDVALAAVTAAELLVGVELADDTRRGTRQRAVEAILSTIPLEVYDLDVARAHAHLLAHTRRSGRPRGAHDLIVAATAVARDRTVVTADAVGFEDLPGVSVRSS